MDKNFTNMDDRFKDAFDSWEADFSPSELQADWSQLSSKISIPQAPATQPPAKPFWGGGKIFGLVGSAAVVTTAAVVIYSSHISSSEKIPAASNNIIVAETPALPEEIKKENTININDVEVRPEDKQANSPANEVFTGKRIYENNNTKADNTAGKTSAKANRQNSENTENPGSSDQPKQLYNMPGQAGNGLRADNNQGNDQKQASNYISKKNLIYSDTVLCLGKELSISYTASQMPDAAVIEWGDGNMHAFTKINKHIYDKPGRYRVRIAEGSRVLEKIITITTLPQASFVNYSCDKMKCKFRNTSKQAYTFVWNFGDGSPELQSNNPEHLYADTGRYLVTLKAYSTAGCYDSFAQVIRVNAFKKPEIFNVLTPDGDGENDRFTVKINDEVYYQIRIFDATGRMVFESRDKRNTWDGTHFNQGNACSQGTYYYVISYKYDLLDPITEEKGYLQLFR